jgi:hypothetical protein
MKPEQIDQLVTSVQSQLGTRVCDLRLLLLDGGFVLQGRARTHYAKQLAQHAVMNATELPLLDNEIQVLSRALAKGTTT